MSKRDEMGFVRFEENTMVIDISQDEWHKMYFKKLGGRPINGEAIRRFASEHIRNIAQRHKVSPENLRLINLADEREE
ncbi:hypothetical protein H9649_12050 [Sporosarcina sp. Sa2YVA2]|uniref:Uncharacterized protein n=1 Tax=Sporosarcina quadrami TaxID=2762234 RepID=A0ABR8UBC6_9BACL|nr:hypothetical protein [Sporosarcina quadrami]MBD7985322.1 hypothetical protein [Sporosarcina quadrami]